MQEKLLILRKKHDFSQEEMAKYLNISSAQYGKKERGLNAFNSDEMFIIRNIFNKPLEEIFLPRNHQNGDKEREEVK